MEYKKSKALEEATYDLDDDSKSSFCMINGAIFTSIDGVDYAGLDSSQKACAEDEVASWTIVITQGRKMGEVMDRVPFGRFNKLITGLGATTLEIETQERNSIIVVPTKSLAYNKSKSTNQKYEGEIYSMYIGSPIKDSGQVDKDKIKDYVRQNNGRKKKFLVVADSLPILISALEDLSIDVYHDYFLMVDEIDTMQSDSVYRPKLENVIDHYLQFDHKQRCMVSATMNEFSNPALEIESCVTTKWRKMPQRNINLIYTNHVDDTAVDEIKRILKKCSEDKILVAYNSLDGILNIIMQLGQQWRPQTGILCSDRSNDKIKTYLEDTDNIIDDRGYLSKRITFMTCAYFAGIDIMDSCHLISITSHLQPFTYLSTGRLAQIAGRCRNGNKSETIIYDIPINTDKSKFPDKERYRKHLINRAKSYADFMNATRKAVYENEELRPLTEFIDSFVKFSSKAKLGNDYPIKILRQNHLTKEFVPAYFNIDALVEDWEMKYVTYAEEDNIYNNLRENNVVNKITRLISQEQHNSEMIQNIKSTEKERRANIVESLKPTLQDWYNNGKSPIAYQELSRKVDKGIKEKFCDTFKRLCDYIEPERLLSDLEERWDDGRKLRNYNNAVIFWALEDTHPFKTHVLALFNYNDTQTLPNSSNLRMITKEDKEAKMKSVFEHSLRLPQGHLLSPDTMKEYFKCFFKTRRASGGRGDLILGLNPENLPEPNERITGDANLFELFMFPQ